MVVHPYLFLAYSDSGSQEDSCVVQVTKKQRKNPLIQSVSLLI